MKKNDFKSFPVRPIRMSDKTWEALKKKKSVSGLTWNKFIAKLLDKKFSLLQDTNVQE